MIMDDKLDSIKSSKDLLYSEYSDTTVVGHVLETLEKKKSMTASERIAMFLKTKKSETLERAKKLISMIDENQEAIQGKEDPVVEDENAVNVVVEITENASDSNRDAWFFLSPSGENVCECSDAESENSSCFFRHKKILGVDSDSSDADEEDEKHTSFPWDCSQSNFDSSNLSESELNNSTPTKKRNLCVSPDKCDKNISMSTKTKSQAEFTEKKNSNCHKSEGTSINSLEKEQLSAIDCNSLMPSNSKGLQLVSPTNSKKRKLISVIEDDLSNAPDQKNSCGENKKRIQT